MNCAPLGDCSLRLKLEGGKESFMLNWNCFSLHIILSKNSLKINQLLRSRIILKQENSNNLFLEMFASKLILNFEI